ncbi:hypothetical protein PoB_002323300 [Plakobranchus ocellatus]|uniref:Uncharacterized protein n=1 Tax=Plakobranchus ocellatus TaxID=259542 RepID=A0AAV3ZQH8_9GAST|nr:hypothetical protein PoB_002323300 [Plakobranchus ocellatus]
MVDGELAWNDNNNNNSSTNSNHKYSNRTKRLMLRARPCIDSSVTCLHKSQRRSELACTQLQVPLGRPGLLSAQMLPFRNGYDATARGQRPAVQSCT